MPQEPRSGRSRRRRRRRRSAGRSAVFAMLYIVLVIGAAAVLASVAWIAANDVLALNKPAHTATITLPEDYFTTETVQDDSGAARTVYSADVDRVAELLQENDLIDYPILFRLFSRLTHSERKLRPGAYQLNTDMDFRALISAMGYNSASRVVVEVTIPEGYTLAQTFRTLAEHGVASMDSLMEYAANYDYKFSFLQDIPLGDANRLEGFLFPDTYKFYVNHDPKLVINKMLQNFDAQYTEEMREQVAAGTYSLRELLTIASLIERESTGNDRALISSVIYNRLERGASAGTNGYLQIDATLFYLTGRTPTEADKSIDSPYNTYKYQGLPPTPIANPGFHSIKAAMSPEKSSYFFYALGDDGEHHFFKDYQSMLNWMKTQKAYQ